MSNRLAVVSLAAAIALAPAQSGALDASSGESCGAASWYGGRFAGRRTANGERMDPNAMTAAHRTFPFGTMVRVTYRGRSVTVRVNDRGPFTGGRVLDLTEAAADRLGYRRRGVARVCYAVVR